MEKQYSLISTGTELACLSGAEGWFRMPGVPGYCCVSKVLEAGEGAPFKPGDMVFHYGAHSRYQIIGDDFAVRVPEGMDLKQVPVIRMATIAFTAVRVSDIELGDVVLVSGLGLVGTMAAQLATLSGATVIGVDPAPSRRRDALGCGIAFAVGPEDAAKTVESVTGGRGVNTLIEATGIPKVAQGYLPLIGYHGEIIFLGTPRGDYQTVLADVLRYCHIDGQGSITFKGAHEWRYPVMEDKFVKHSIERNTRVCMDLLGKGRLKAAPLISHVIKPREAPEVYLAVNEDRDRYTGIVIDWT
jgi:2-desacetyl-2-hydroxyethyl bacteriochlorophyllide A dehydrogenase